MDMAEAEILRVINGLDSTDSEIRENVEMIRNEVRLILDFLAGKKWEKEGSKLKYWMTDVLEIVLHTHLLMHDEDPYAYYTLSKQLKPICKAIREIKKRILQLEVEWANNSPITFLSPLEGLDENVVGLEQDVESLLRKLILHERRGLYTMCIVGMTGTGKTTLARKLFNHSTVVDRYEPRVWVSVSGESSNKELLMRIVQQVLHYKDQALLWEEMENADNESLQRMIHQHLQGKKFLIVLDDVGLMPYFKSIVSALPQKYTQSRLLLTSRFRSIVYRLTIYSDVHIMKPLDDDRSWQLFLKLLLFDNQEFPKHLERKGREMLRRCDGLPLSIKEVATQFVTKRQGGSKWEELLESIDLSTTLAVLGSVYQRWPPQLKSCFLCLSFFKKNIPIKREKVIQVWTAGQVIPQEENEDDNLEGAFRAHLFSMTGKLLSPSSMEDLEGYKTTLMMLFDESIIEIDISKDQCIKCIRINASFHTLSMVKAEEEMVFEILKKGERNPPSSRKKPPHRAISCTRDEFDLFTDHDECLVSLYFHGGGYFDASELYWKRFKQLRTLDFEGYGLKVLPETIGALTELRYLGLRNNYIHELPRSLGCLKNLEVLDIALNFMIEVPDIVWGIGSLRHLCMSDITCRKPLKIYALKKLETLTYISVDNWICEVSSLKMMISLRKLGIEEVDENSDVSKLFASLANLRYLDCLILRGFRYRSLPSLHGLETLNHLTELKLDGLLSKLPSADIFPRKISRLSLINSCLDEDPMPELGKLHYLSYLKLKNAYNGQLLVIPKQRFRNLAVLCIEELWHLRNIQVDKDLPPWVRNLEIKSCPYLENFPENIVTYGMKEIKTLTTEKLAAKIRKLDFISTITHVDIQP